MREVIRDMIHEHSSIMAGSEFADQFIKRRRADIAGRPVPAAMGNNGLLRFTQPQCLSY